jgi:GDP-L-fucose synthase
MPTLLLTGGSGLVGRNIQNYYASNKWNIIAPTSNDLNLMDYTAVKSFFNACKPDIILHCAGRVGGISANIMEPVAFLDTNIIIGRNVIMGAREAKIKRLINLASTCIYPREAQNPLKEECILEGKLEPTNEGYAIAKIVALRLCQYIRKEDPGYNYKTLIPCNLYGRFDKFDPKKSHLLPAIIHKIHHAKITDKQSVEIWGDGSARREFMYVEDLADAIYFAMESILDIPDLMNIGVGTDYTIKEYYESVSKVIGWQGEFVFDHSKPTGMAQKLSDTSLQSKWGWQPKTTLEEGIRSTYKYYLENVF